MSESLPNRLIFDEAQLILSEKRTALSTLRTGLSVFVLPLSVGSILTATSRFYSPEKVIHLLIPLFGISIVLIVLAFILIIRAMVRLHHLDKLLDQLKEQNELLSGLFK